MSSVLDQGQTTPSLLQQAASGSTVAQLGLADLAINAGVSGTIRPIESLIAAETWARLAAARGGIDEQRTLVGVLLGRAEFEWRRSSIYGAQWYEGEARRLLKLLAAVDDESKEALEELGDKQAHEPDPPDTRTLGLISAAAGGDLYALATLFDEAMDLLSSGQANALEALTASELYARLGATTGDLGLMHRLVRVLLKRAEFEHREGSGARGNAGITEAAVLMSILVDNGDQSTAPWLHILANDFATGAIAEAARWRPTILKFVEPQGVC